MGRREIIKPLPSQGELLRLFLYDQESGVLTWRIRPNQQARRVIIGGKAGAINAKSGYLVVGIARVYYLAHRIIWKMVTGNEPEDQIDHKDGDKLNNRWLNLRPTSNGPNIQNSKIRKDNTSGVKGVFWETQHKKWRAVITADGKHYRLGRYSTIAEAAKIIEAKRLELHGAFARI